MNIDPTKQYGNNENTLTSTESPSPGVECEHGSLKRQCYICELEEEIKKIKLDRKILTAAVKTSDGVIHIMPRPKGHDDIVHALWKAKEYKRKIKIEGFLADDGNFYNRREAGKIAMNSGQVTKLEYPPTLFSEDIW